MYMSVCEREKEMKRREREKLKKGERERNDSTVKPLFFPNHFNLGFQYRKYGIKDD